MHKDHVWRVDGSGGQAVGHDAADVNVLLFNFFSRSRLGFLCGALHIFASDHTSGARTDQGRQVDAKFVRQPPCRGRGIGSPTRADRRAGRGPGTSSRCFARRWLLVQCLGFLPLDLGILTNQRRHLFIGQVFTRRDNDGKSSSDGRVLSLRYFQPAQDSRC